MHIRLSIVPLGSLHVALRRVCIEVCANDYEPRMLCCFVPSRELNIILPHNNNNNNPGNYNVVVVILYDSTPWNISHSSLEESSHVTDLRFSFISILGKEGIFSVQFLLPFPISPRHTYNVKFQNTPAREHVGTVVIAHYLFPLFFAPPLPPPPARQITGICPDVGCNTIHYLLCYVFVLCICNARR